MTLKFEGVVEKLLTINR